MHLPHLKQDNTEPANETLAASRRPAGQAKSPTRSWPHHRPIVSEIRVKTVLNVNDHVGGGWFWTKYSALPYMGCAYGCSYCFLRRNFDAVDAIPEAARGLSDPFSQYIRAKINGAEILDQELSNVPTDVIVTGDYQPVDKTYRLSREFLKVCLRHRFPTLIMTKSPTVLRDLDVIQALAEISWTCVVFTIPNLEDREYRRLFEPFAPSMQSRLAAMSKLSSLGVYTGTALMPALPFISDTEANLRSIVRRTAESGGKFVVAGGLVLGNGVEKHFYDTLEAASPALVSKYHDLYQGAFSPQDRSWAALGRAVRELCLRQGIDYRMKRFIPASPLARNKQIAERLFSKVYEMELEERPQDEIESYRELACRIDELSTPISSLIGESEVTEPSWLK